MEKEEREYPHHPIILCGPGTKRDNEASRLIPKPNEISLAIQLAEGKSSNVKRSKKSETDAFLEAYLPATTEADIEDTWHG